jgi:uncharacterized protein (DUF924 family)
MVYRSQVTEQDILDFWFSATNRAKWFSKEPAFDQEITDKFLGTYETAANRRLDYGQDSQAGTLASVILLDQFPRNMFRGTAKSFATDNKALALTKYAIAERMDRGLDDDHRQFLYMPLMHSEEIEDQKLGIELFAYNPQMQLYAKRHMEIIDKFGRFPHRNEILGRKSTDEELEFLKSPNSGF